MQLSAQALEIDGLGEIEIRTRAPRFRPLLLLRGAIAEQ
jgi:hypothetical protein